MTVRSDIASALLTACAADECVWSDLYELAISLRRTDGLAFEDFANGNSDRQNFRQSIEHFRDMIDPEE